MPNDRFLKQIKSLLLILSTERSKVQSFRSGRVHRDRESGRAEQHQVGRKRHRRRLGRLPRLGRNRLGHEHRRFGKTTFSAFIRTLD